MIILGLETSCDDTAIALVQDGTKILSNIVQSQIDLFAAYGGVIPEIAARSHLEAILPVLDTAMQTAHLSWADIDAIATTHTPGLFGSLLIGTLTARTLAILHHKPLYAVHHLKSHIYANWLEPSMSHNIDNPPFQTSQMSHNLQKPPTFSAKNPSFASPPTFPLLALVISGGHTQLIYMKKHNHFQIIGTTRDDAVGECFDKIAKILGLPYPGGPSITAAALGQFPSPPSHINLANSSNFLSSSKPHTSPLDSKVSASPSSLPGNPKKYSFPHPQVPNLDFSFSGLKTAVLRTVQKELGVPISFPSYQLAPLLSPQQKADFAASFQTTAVDILLEKLSLALDQHPDVQSIVFAGGVSANSALKATAINRFFSSSLNTDKFSSSQVSSSPTSSHTSANSSSSSHPLIFFPAPKLSGDNGAMVAAAAFFEAKSHVPPTDPYHLQVLPTSLIS